MPGTLSSSHAEDLRSLFVADFGRGFPAHVVRLDLTTGKRDPWLELAPPDRAGFAQFLELAVTPNGRSYAYSYVRMLKDLYVVEGLR